MFYTENLILLNFVIISIEYFVHNFHSLDRALHYIFDIFITY